MRIRLGGDQLGDMSMSFLVFQLRSSEAFLCREPGSA